MTDIYSAMDLPRRAEDVYTQLVSHGPRTAASVAQLADLEQRQADELLKELERVGLVARDPAGLLRACPPRAAVELWAARREVEAIEARVAGEELSRLFAAGPVRASDSVEILEDHQATVELVRTLQSRARHDVRILARGAGLPTFGTGSEPEGAVVDSPRRVEHRTVHDTAVLQDPERLAEFVSSRERGEQSRSFAGVPLTMLVSDDDLGLIILPATSGEGVALAVYRSSLLDALIELFESFWRIAHPVAADPGAGAATAGAASCLTADLAEVDDDTRRMLELLGAGLTDSAIARALGISVRTLHRRISRLQERCGLETRYQLGLHVARQGLA